MTFIGWWRRGDRISVVPPFFSETTFKMKEITITEDEVKSIPNDFELGEYVRKKMNQNKEE